MSASANILVVDDDETVRALVSACAVKAGYRVCEAEDAAGMRAWMIEDGIDLILLDVNLPDGDGFELARELRRTSDVGIIMVTERGEPDDRAQGIEQGADDYLPKPVYPRELLARVKSVLDRRTGRSNAGGALRFDEYSLDVPGRRLLDKLGRAVDVTPAEFDLLEMLAARPGRIQSRESLTAALGGDDSESGLRSIDILVSRLRKKLGDNGPAIIETVRGRGYRFAAKVGRG